MRTSSQLAIAIQVSKPRRGLARFKFYHRRYAAGCTWLASYLCFTASESSSCTQKSTLSHQLQSRETQLQVANARRNGDTRGVLRSQE
jgi:hypothetical protein